MVYRITAPEPGLNITIAGVVLTDSVGYIPESQGALNYFGQRGYTIEALDPDDPQQPTLDTSDPNAEE